MQVMLERSKQLARLRLPAGHLRRLILQLREGVRDARDDTGRGRAKDVLPKLGENRSALPACDASHGRTRHLHRVRLSQLSRPQTRLSLQA